jgi:hypothetical protein
MLRALMPTPAQFPACKQALICGPNTAIAGQQSCSRPRPLPCCSRSLNRNSIAATTPPCHLLRHCPELVELQQLGHDFKQAFQLQSAEALSAWMEKASRSTFGAIHRFTTGLRRDEAAIAAAVSLPWSNGQVEGQVHRLKLIKRQMYGRAGFQLPRRRVLPYKYDRCFANSYRAP